MEEKLVLHWYAAECPWQRESSALQLSASKCRVRATGIHLESFILWPGGAGVVLVANHDKGVRVLPPAVCHHLMRKDTTLTALCLFDPSWTFVRRRNPFCWIDFSTAARYNHKVSGGEARKSKIGASFGRTG